MVSGLPKYELTIEQACLCIYKIQIYHYQNYLEVGFLLLVWNILMMVDVLIIEDFFLKEKTLILIK